MLTAMMPIWDSTIDQRRAREWYRVVGVNSDFMERMRISWAMVTRVPRRKQKPITRFFRMEKQEWRRIGMGVSILVGC